MEKKRLLNTKEVAAFLDVNEKVVYSLIAEKGLPATKVTGKWLFPRHLVEQWVENNTVNYPRPGTSLPPYHGLVIIAGSNDILLERTISLFNRLYPDQVVVFGNLGSLGGLRALRRNLCHMATSHLMEDDGTEYNFGYAQEELSNLPAVVNFCKREQGLLLAKGNPKGVRGIEDLKRSDIKVVNRPMGTGTRLLFDRKLIEAGMTGESVKGYDHELGKHLDVGLEILAGRADAGPAIRAVAQLLDLDFIPWRWERFDLLIPKERFFDKGVQTFLGLIHEKEFTTVARGLGGYDLTLSGRMVYPQGQEKGGE